MAIIITLKSQVATTDEVDSAQEQVNIAIVRNEGLGKRD